MYTNQPSTLSSPVSARCGCRCTIIRYPWLVNPGRGPESDVDVLVEFTRPVGYFEFSDLERHLTEILGCKVDLFTANRLGEDIGADVLREAVRAA